VLQRAKASLIEPEVQGIYKQGLVAVRATERHTACLCASYD
jgi:hypothetical protein